MKGIILAAGKGTRLGAATLGVGDNGVGVSKPLIPTYDKPTIYYPLSDLIMAGITDILVIAAPDNIDQFKATLGNGADLGFCISYKVQVVPKGIAEAFIIAEDFIGDDKVALIFGDNVFNGNRFAEALRAAKDPEGATIFAYYVPNPTSFGVVEFDADGRAISLEEKPSKPRSHYAVPGVYFYDSSVVDVAKGGKPSARGELEITSVNEEYLNRGKLSVVTLDSDTDWFDTGLPESLLEAANAVAKYQRDTDRLLGSPEAEAYRAGLITKEELLALAEKLKKSTYGQALITLATEGW